MAKNSITKATADPVIFPVNNRSSEARYSIQNETGAALAVEVTNNNVQKTAPGSVVWSDPASGPASIADGEADVVLGPYVALRFSGTGTGKVRVVEEY